jgi:Ca2+-binding EF-hand superfamily protein
MGLDVRRAHLDALILQYNDGKLNHISLEIVMKLFEKFERRDKREELDRAFELIMEGSASNDKITPHHLIKLPEDVGEPISIKQAQAMMQNWNGQWSKADLERILSSSSTTGTHAASGNVLPVDKQCN